MAAGTLCTAQTPFSPIIHTYTHTTDLLVSTCKLALTSWLLHGGWRVVLSPVQDEIEHHPLREDNFRVALCIALSYWV